jgi:hypothetical protein
MNPFRKALIAAGLVGTTLVGGATGAYLFANSTANAATTTTTPSNGNSSTPPASQAGPGGTFHSNEDPTHEAGESAAREAQENAGQVPTVP